MPTHNINAIQAHTAMHPNRRKLIQIAQRWRDSNPGHTEGVVLVWDGAVYGWKNVLRDPQDEAPGAYAVDFEGNVYIAEGGDEYNGSAHWVVL